MQGKSLLWRGSPQKLGKAAGISFKKEPTVWLQNLSKYIKLV